MGNILQIQIWGADLDELFVHELSNDSTKKEQRMSLEIKWRRQLLFS